MGIHSTPQLEHTSTSMLSITSLSLFSIPLNSTTSTTQCTWNFNSYTSIFLFYYWFGHVAFFYASIGSFDTYTITNRIPCKIPTFPQ